MNKNLLVYASSAGSGKTFTLTKEYLKLCLADHPDPNGEIRFSPTYFRHILAVTFTNDAANEMKERILSTLEGIANYGRNSVQTQKKVSAIREAILLEINEIPDQIPIDFIELERRAYTVFRVMIHRYSEVSVSTIDSFTQRIVSAFTEELRLPYTFEVSLETDLLLAAAVEQLLARAGQDNYETLTEILAAFAEETTEQGRSWAGLPKEIARFGAKLLDDTLRGHIASLAELDTTDFTRFRKRFQKYQKDTEKEISEIAGKAVQTMYDQGLTSANFTQPRSGIGAYFEQRASGNKILDPPNTYAKEAIEQDKWLTAANQKNRELAHSVAAIKPTLVQCYEEMEALREERSGRCILYAAWGQHLHKLALLKQLATEIESIEDLSGQIHISKFNQKILEIVLNEPIPFVYERLGETYKHILMDEFQDTSEVQWLNFMPLIDNNLAAEQLNLIVGDAKQSIYRFRGGEMQLLIGLHQKKRAVFSLDNDFVDERLDGILRNVSPKKLDVNRRSCAEIIQFNNALFKDILEKNQAEFNNLPELYSGFIQAMPEHPKSGGFVEVHFIQKSEETLGEMLAYTWECIQSQLADGFLQRDIAVLCRKNSDAREIANFLKTCYLPDGSPLQLISADSLSLSSSEAVNLTIALLRLLHSPDHRMARYEAAYLFFKKVLQRLPDAQENNRIRTMVEDSAVSAFFVFLQEYGFAFEAARLRKAGLYALTEELLGRLGLFGEATELPYLFRLLDVLQDFTIRQSGHLGDFLAFWEQKQDTLAINTPPDANAITIQSVHKSKGLEYPVVIVPYTNWTTVPNFRTELWGDLTQDIFTDYEELTLRNDLEEPLRKLKVGLASFKKELEETPLNEQYQKEKTDTFLDNLNLLYVALTRPTQRLFVGIELPKKATKNHVGNFFQEFIGATDAQDTYHWRGENWISGVAPESQVISQVIENQKDIWPLGEVVSVNRTDTMRLRRQVERLFELGTFEQQKEWGNKVHTALRGVNIPEDLPNVLSAMEQRGMITPSERPRLHENLGELLELPSLKPFFELPAKFIIEREILTPKGEALRPDRAVVLPDGSVAILDYKTGTPRESHREQVKRYARLYRQMGYKNVAMFLVYVESREVVEVG